MSGTGSWPTYSAEDGATRRNTLPEDEYYYNSNPNAEALEVAESIPSEPLPHSLTAPPPSRRLHDPNQPIVPIQHNYVHPSAEDMQETSPSKEAPRKMSVEHQQPPPKQSPHILPSKPHVVTVPIGLDSPPPQRRRVAADTPLPRPLDLDQEPPPKRKLISSETPLPKQSSVRATPDTHSIPVSSPTNINPGIAPLSSQPKPTTPNETKEPASTPQPVASTDVTPSHQPPMIRKLYSEHTPLPTPPPFSEGAPDPYTSMPPKQRKAYAENQPLPVNPMVSWDAEPSAITSTEEIPLDSPVAMQTSSKRCSIDEAIKHQSMSLTPQHDIEPPVRRRIHSVDAPIAIRSQAELVDALPPMSTSIDGIPQSAAKDFARSSSRQKIRKLVTPDRSRIGENSPSRKERPETVPEHNPAILPVTTPDEESKPKRSAHIKKFKPRTESPSPGGESRGSIYERNVAWSKKMADKKKELGGEDELVTDPKATGRATSPRQRAGKADTPEHIRAISPTPGLRAVSPQLAAMNRSSPQTSSQEPKPAKPIGFNKRFGSPARFASSTSNTYSGNGGSWIKATGSTAAPSREDAPPQSQERRFGSQAQAHTDRSLEQLHEYVDSALAHIIDPGQSKQTPEKQTSSSLKSLQQEHSDIMSRLETMKSRGAGRRESLPTILSQSRENNNSIPFRPTSPELEEREESPPPKPLTPSAPMPQKKFAESPTTSPNNVVIHMTEEVPELQQHSVRQSPPSAATATHRTSPEPNQRNRSPDIHRLAVVRLPGNDKQPSESEQKPTNHERHKASDRLASLAQPKTPREKVAVKTADPKPERTESPTRRNLRKNLEKQGSGHLATRTDSIRPTRATLSRPLQRSPSPAPLSPTPEKREVRGGKDSSREQTYTLSSAYHPPTSKHHHVGHSSGDGTSPREVRGASPRETPSRSGSGEARSPREKISREKGMESSAVAENKTHVQSSALLTPVQSNGHATAISPSLSTASTVDWEVVLPFSRGIVVYEKSESDENIVGEVIIDESSTVEDMISMIKEELEVAYDFRVRKRKIPIARKQLTRLAGDFFRADEDFAIISPVS